MQIEVLGERYQLQEPIGRGGMATIYRGRDMRMERTVAIKVLREAYSTDPKFVTRFQREAKAASSLQHPNIVQVYDYGQSEGNYFIVMELVEGTDLRRYLRSRGILATDRAIIIAHDVALGLGAAHRRSIVHRDVKPQNVLVGRDGSIKLTDFGIASVYKDINAERLTTTGMTLGTVQYYAPEQAQGEIVNPAADVYALGIVMYEMLTGRTPFDGDSPVAVAMQHIQDIPIPPSQFNPNIQPALEDIIMRCLEKVPEMRYRDGSSLARALELLGEDEMGENLPTQINPPSLPPSLPNNGQLYNQIPPRPANGSRTDGNNNNGNSGYPGNQPPRSSSSPNNVMGAMPYNPNSVYEPPNGGNAMPGMPPADINNLPTINARNSMVNGYEQYQPQDRYGPVSPIPLDLNGSGTTRPFDRGSLSRSGVIQDQRESRFASIITVLILLATLLLLGFSIYLAIALGFIALPGKSTTTTPTPNGTVLIPNLVGKTYAQAQQIVSNDKLNLSPLTADPTLCVIKQGPAQSPDNQQMIAVNSTIVVTLGPCPAVTPTVTVPDGLVGQTRQTVTAKLASLGINYTLVSAGKDATKPLDYVQKLDPTSGTKIPVSQNVMVYIVNCTACTAGTPTAAPGKTPTPTPTTGITPTPTPTTGITPTPTPTTGITPTPTPTTGITPTPTPTPPPKPDPTPGG